jgi:uncharacterized protein YrrD
MLSLSNTILNKPVLSIRSGSSVAIAVKPIINPNNLKIEGFYCTDRYNRKKQIVLVQTDIRDIIPDGIVVNDHDSLSDPSELPRLQPIINLDFELIGKQVTTVSKSKVGKVSDYAIDSSSLYIQKLYVNQSLIHSFSGGTLSIDRSQIIEITNKRIVVSDLLQGVKASAPIPA